MKPVEIRKAAIPDFGRIAQIYNEHIQLGQSTMEESTYTAQRIQSWVEAFDHRERLYVMEKNGAVIGWGIIKKYSPREGYRYTAETAVYLTQGETRKGYGSTFKRFLIDQARQLDYHHLVAKIFSTNQASIDYNLKLGYTIVGHQKEIGFKNGRWQDVTILQLIL